jgi:CHASE3 domain sensor protein
LSQTASRASANRNGAVAKPRVALPIATTIGLGLAVLAVAFIALFTYRSLQARSEAAQRVNHSLRSIEQLETVLSTAKDAETGQRGFLLTGQESYLDPFLAARGRIAGELANLRRSIEGLEQRERLTEVARVSELRFAQLQEVVELQRSGKMNDARDLIRSGQGKQTMDRLRQLIAALQAHEHQELEARQRAWREAAVFSTWVNWGGSALLLACIAGAALVMSQDHRARARRQWLQLAQMALSERLQGEQRLEQLGESVIGFLAPQLDAQLGSIYLAERDGSFRRFAAYALPPSSMPEQVRPGEGLLGQAAKSRSLLHVRDVPEDFVQVESSLGRSRPRELVLLPALYEGRVQAVIELGFLSRVQPEDLELLSAVVDSIGIAVRSSKDRTRLEELLEETQRQAEELQAQQEELRVSNEELEEQGRVLKESQQRLENQQAELEQTNSQLEEQTQLLEAQKADLASAQRVLQLKASELERASQYKSEFLANMSHELRTPLN